MVQDSFGRRVRGIFVSRNDDDRKSARSRQCGVKLFHNRIRSLSMSADRASSTFGSGHAVCAFVQNPVYAELDTVTHDPA